MDVGMRSVVFFALFAVLNVHSATAMCPDGSVTGFNRWTCYKVYPTALSWIKAERQCKAENGHLATASSASNNSFLQEVAGNVALSNYWLGGAMDRSDGAWYWSDDSSWNYTNWATCKCCDCRGFRADTCYWGTPKRIGPVNHRGLLLQGLAKKQP